MSDSITNQENLTNKDAHIEHTQHTSNCSTESSEMQGKSSNLVYFSIGKNIKDKSVKNEECEWQEFKDALINPQKYTVRYNHFKTDDKTGKFLQDKETGDYIELSHDEAVLQIISREKKKMPYFVGGHFKPEQRNDKNLQFRSLLVLDIDKYKSSIEELGLLLDKELSQYEYIAYSTASHTPKTPCIRVVIRCEKQIPTKEYKKVVTNFIEGLSFKECIDVASATASQAMYLPAIIEITEQPEGQEYSYEYWKNENTGSGIDYNNFVSKSKKSAKSPSINSVNKHKFPKNKIPKLLEIYPAADLEYQKWLEVGMALHHYYEGMQEGLILWDSWSALHKEKYEPEKIKTKYASFKAETINPITIETIAKRASELNIKKIDDLIFYKRIGNYEFLLTDKTLSVIVEKTEDGLKQKVPMRISDYIELKARGFSSSGQHCNIFNILDKNNNYTQILIPLNAKNDNLKQFLYDAGLTIPPQHFHYLVSYIIDNKTNINVSLEYRLGWKSDLSRYNLIKKDGIKTFYRNPDNKQQKSILEFKLKESDILEQKGSLENWQYNIVQYCDKNSILTFSLLYSFVPIFLSPLYREPLIVHFFGDSSIGKTIALQVASSVWGNPDKGYAPWKGTIAGFDNLALQKNDSILCMDELTTLDKQYLHDIPYQLLMGVDKARADSRGIGFGNRASRKWSTTILSTGEYSYKRTIKGSGADLTGGQSVRFVDIPVKLSNDLGVFECLHFAQDLGENSRKNAKIFAENFKDACAKYKGVAIEYFLEYCFNKCKFDEVLKKVEHLKKEWLQSNLPDATQQVGRVAEFFSIIAAVGEVVIESRVLPAKYGFVKGVAFENVKKIFNLWLKQIGDYTISAEVKTVKERLLKFFWEYHSNGFYKQDTGNLSSKKVANSNLNVQENSDKFDYNPRKDYKYGYDFQQRECVGIVLPKPKHQEAHYSTIDQETYYCFQQSIYDIAFKGLDADHCIKVAKQNCFFSPYPEKYKDGKIKNRSRHIIYYGRTRANVSCFLLNLNKLGVSEMPPSYEQADVLQMSKISSAV